ncbi:MAG: isoprenylcysteine carboxylmethyltransferase family protein, partial [Candidatus Thorarchaeota archaeon]
GYYRFVKPRQEEDAEVAERAAFGKVQAALTFVILGFLISSVLYLIGLPWMDWFQIPQYPFWLRMSGSLLVLVAIPLLTWVHRELDRQYSAILEIKKNHKLITTGPYEKVRHPMYTVLAMFSVGMALVTANLLIILFGVLLMMGFPFWAHIEYMKRTGRFFPPIKPSKDLSQ